MVYLDPKHGVNPMLTNCYYCNKPSGVALIGRAHPTVKEALLKAGAPVGPDGEAPHRGVVFDKDPCTKCREFMDQGVILISVDEGKTDDTENPYRTGGWVVVSTDFIERVFSPPELVEQVLDMRMAWVPDDAWDMLRLPRGEKGPTP